MKYIIRRKMELAPASADMLRELHSAQLAHAALTGQERAEGLREAQTALYRGLVQAGEGRERAFSRAYGTPSGVGSAVVMPLRDPSSKGHAGLYREMPRRGERRAGELDALAEAQRAGKIRRVG